MRARPRALKSQVVNELCGLFREVYRTQFTQYAQHASYASSLFKPSLRPLPQGTSVGFMQVLAVALTVLLIRYTLYESGFGGVSSNSTKLVRSVHAPLKHVWLFVCQNCRLQISPWSFPDRTYELYPDSIPEGCRYRLRTGAVA